MEDKKFIEDFVYKEIKEVAKLHNLDSEKIFEYYNICDLKINDLKKIEDLGIRSCVYEFLCLFPKNFYQDCLFQDIFKLIENIHNKKEKNYLVEKKTILKIKTLHSLMNDQSLNTINQKIAYIIYRRLFFIQNPDNEYDSNNEVELTTLLQQIRTDIFLYFNTLQIILKRDIENLNENHLKSYILRILKTLSNFNKNIEFNLKNISNKSIYFIKNKGRTKNFLHFYARVYLCPPQFIKYKNLGLNGGFHYLNKRKIIEPNSYNDDVKIKDKIWDFVRKQNETNFYIDKKMIEILNPDICAKLEKDKIINKEWGEFFSEIKDLSETEINDILKLEKYKNKLKKGYYLKDINNLDTLKKIEEKIENEKNKNNKTKVLDNLKKKQIFLKKLINENKLSYSPSISNKWIQKDFSYAFLIKIYLEFVEFFKDYDEALYFAIYFDFRGRYYHNSMVSPSNGWPFRFLYNFGLIKDNQKNNNILYILKNEDYSDILNSLEKRLGILNEKQKNYALWILMSIGAITIKKKEIIKDREFIDEGYKNYINKIRSSDLLETSELNYYYLILDDLPKEKWNRYLIKDVSGSIFQNAALILGIKDDESLNSLNIHGLVYKDPYFKLIEKIQENVDDDLKFLFTRKTLKKSIMTKYYNATLFTSFRYFIKEVRNIQNYDENKYDFIKIWLTFKKVYESLKNLEKEVFFQYSSEDYNNFLKKNKVKEIHYDDFSFSIICYKLFQTRIDLKVNEQRITCTNYQQSKEIFKTKTKNSMMPNIFHGEDSNRARSLINYYSQECFSIHDAFAISYLNVEKFIIDANSSFDINITREFYIGKNEIKYSTFSKYKAL